MVHVQRHAVVVSRLVIVVLLWKLLMAVLLAPVKARRLGLATLSAVPLTAYGDHGVNPERVRLVAVVELRSARAVSPYPTNVVVDLVRVERRLEHLATPSAVQLTVSGVLGESLALVRNHVGQDLKLGIV